MHGIKNFNEGVIVHFLSNTDALNTRCFLCDGIKTIENANSFISVYFNEDKIKNVKDCAVLEFGGKNVYMCNVDAFIKAARLK